VAVRTLVRTATVTGLGLATVVLTVGAAEANPTSDYQMPFACGQEWTGSTRSYHSPSSKAVDFNRPNDLGKPVVAPAAGVITRVTDLGNRSYGKYIVVDHGATYTTLHAHLNAMYVFVGQRVDQGQVIGTVGTSGGSTGPHLHFEQKRGSTVMTPYFDGKVYSMPQTSASKNCARIPLAGDWNDKGATNLGVFDRRWRGSFVQKIGRRTVNLTFGRGIDWPIVGDWDGDGKTDIGVRRAMRGRFLLRRADGTVDKTIALGGRRHVGVAGDWDGDGTTEVGIWRPKDTDFRIRLAGGKLRTVDLGSVGSLPVTGDFNGDGRTDVGVFDPVTATWSLRSTGVGGPAWSTTVTAGVPGELPVVGDWDNDGTDDLATWNRDTGAWTRVSGIATAPRTTVMHFGAQP
jgi:hypothetical protein